MHVYVYYVCMSASIYAFMYVRMYVDMYASMYYVNMMLEQQYASMYGCTYVCMHVRIYVYYCACTHANTEYMYNKKYIKMNLTFCLLRMSISFICLRNPSINSTRCFSSILIRPSKASHLLFSPDTPD